MKPMAIGITVLLGLLAAVEHVGLLWWGVLWPLGNLTAYPGDDGVNLFVAEASLLFLAFSLAAAADLRRATPRPGRVLMLAAMALALPCGICVSLILMNVLFLDPVVAYLTLLPGLAAVVCPYALAAHLFHRRSARPTPMAEVALHAG